MTAAQAYQASMAVVTSFPSDTEPSTPVPPRVVRVELSCLMCGEVAGLLEDRRIVRPRAQGSIRYDGRRLTCGRCGSILMPGDEDRTS
jgi:hypothetical protein